MARPPVPRRLGLGLPCARGSALAVSRSECVPLGLLVSGAVCEGSRVNEQGPVTGLAPAECRVTPVGAVRLGQVAAPRVVPPRAGEPAGCGPAGGAGQVWKGFRRRQQRHRPTGGSGDPEVSEGWWEPDRHGEAASGSWAPPACARFQARCSVSALCFCLCVLFFCVIKNKAIKPSW